jgi:competence ComEA-like helix-hairpin-helix protein
MAHRLFRNGILWAVACVLIQAAAFATTKKPPVHPININSATSEELQQVPGIGPSTADKILQMRKSYGAFKSVDDLLAIRGIGPKRLGKMRKYLVAGRMPQPTRPSSATTKPANCAACAKSSSPPRKQAAPLPVAVPKPSKSRAPDASTSETADEEPESK